MDYDTIIIKNEYDIDETFYVLALLNYNNYNYIYYAKEFKDKYNLDDVYVGKLVNNSIEPVEEDVIFYLDSKLRELGLN